MANENTNIFKLKAAISLHIGAIGTIITLQHEITQEYFECQKIVVA